MNKRSWLALLLALALALSLCLTGCASRDREDKDDDEDDEKTEESVPPVEDEDDEDAASDEDDMDLDEEDEEDEDDGQWIQDGLFKLGTVHGSVYENEMLGIGCDLKGWTYAGSEELARVNQWGSDSFDEEILESLAEAQSVTEMIAQSEGGLQNVVITVQNMKEVYGRRYTEASMNALTMAQLPAMMQSAGYTDVTVKAGTAEFCGETHDCILMESSYQGMNVYQTQISFAVDDYMFYICFTSFLEDANAETMAQFYTL